MEGSAGSAYWADDTPLEGDSVPLGIKNSSTSICQGIPNLTNLSNKHSFIATWILLLPPTMPSTDRSNISTRPSLTRRGASCGGSQGNHVMSLVRTSDPPEAPIPPSLQRRRLTRGLSISTRTLPLEHTDETSETGSPKIEPPFSPLSPTLVSNKPKVWYDYDEFNVSGRLRANSQSSEGSNESAKETMRALAPCMLQRRASVPPSKMRTPAFERTESSRPNSPPSQEMRRGDLAAYASSSAQSLRLSLRGHSIMHPSSPEPQTRRLET